MSLSVLKITQDFPAPKNPGPILGLEGASGKTAVIYSQLKFLQLAGFASLFSDSVFNYFELLGEVMIIANIWGLLYTRWSSQQFYQVSTISGASLMAQMVKNLPVMRETQVRSLGQEDPLEKRMATHSIFLRLPWWLRHFQVTQLRQTEIKTPHIINGWIKIELKGCILQPQHWTISQEMDSLHNVFLFLLPIPSNPSNLIISLMDRFQGKVLWDSVWQLKLNGWNHLLLPQIQRWTCPFSLYLKQLL